MSRKDDDGKCVRCETGVGVANFGVCDSCAAYYATKWKRPRVDLGRPTHLERIRSLRRVDDVYVFSLAALAVFVLVAWVASCSRQWARVAPPIADASPVDSADPPEVTARWAVEIDGVAVALTRLRNTEFTCIAQHVGAANDRPLSCWPNP